MSTLIPPPAPVGPPILTVDPTLLAQGAQPSVAAAAALRSCAAVLAPVWRGAAQAVSLRLTGSALSAAEAAVISGLGVCAHSLESLGRALEVAAGVYRDSDDQAVVSAPADAADGGRP